MQVEQLLQALIIELENNLTAQIKAAKDAHNAATHSESVAETKWDTFGLESSYLAQGQQKRVEQSTQTLQYFLNVAKAKRHQRHTIELNTLILLENPPLKRLFFLAQMGGGLQCQFNGEIVTVITVESPIGKQLIHKCTGDEVEIRQKGVYQRYEVGLIT